MLIRSEFIEYIKRVENGARAGYKSGTWSPHPSPEGGNDTIGYGHKLRNDEEWMKGGVSDEEIEKLLFKDVVYAAEAASEVIDEYGSDDFENLPQMCQEIFTDFVFNLGGSGLRKFPKFVDATINDNKETMKQEYKRYYRTGSGELRELEQRNSEFYNMFLA
mgnify:FL=1